MLWAAALTGVLTVAWGAMGCAHWIQSDRSGLICGDDQVGEVLRGVGEVMGWGLNYR